MSAGPTLQPGMSDSAESQNSASYSVDGRKRAKRTSSSVRDDERRPESGVRGLRDSASTNKRQQSCTPPRLGVGWQRTTRPPTPISYNPRRPTTQRSLTALRSQHHRDHEDIRIKTAASESTRTSSTSCLQPSIFNPRSSSPLVCSANSLIPVNSLIT